LSVDNSDNPIGVTSAFSIIWDGDGLGLGSGPNGAFDITEGGTNDGFTIRFAAPISQQLGLGFEVADPDGGSSVFDPTLLLSAGTAGDAFLPFADFTGTVDFEKLNSVTLFLTADVAGLEGLIDYVSATPDSSPPPPLPVPATIPLVMLGLLHLAVARRQSRSK
ncbi:MAG: hypothetical protein WBG92_14665, partial [Thiohalocapsa sp.]